MEQNENMAVQDESFETESLSEELAEEPQDDSLPLDDETGDSTEQQDGNEQPQSAGGQKEPGWFRQRWEKEVGKLTAQIRDEVRSEYEAQMAPMREYMITQEAQELVQSGKVKDLETAKELVRYRQGQPQPAGDDGQPRNEKGQFTAQQKGPSPATQARIDMLQHQARKIEASGGPDVRAEFRNNPDVRNKIITGEMDFYDVADMLRQNSKRKPPSPMRSPNGASGNQKTPIDSMSDEQFEKLVKKVQGGARYSQR